MSVHDPMIEMVLRSMPSVTVGLLDDRMRLVDAAGSWLRRSGQRLEELLGRPLAQVAGRELAATCEPAVRAALAGSTTRLQLENPVRAVDPGAPAWIDVVVQPAPAQDGEARAFWLVRDVTDEHALGDALSTAEQRLRLLDEGAREYAMIGLDLDGVVTTWNLAAQRLLGHTPHDVVGRHLSRLFTPDDARLGVVHGLLRRADADGSRRTECWLQGAHGVRLWCQVTVRPLLDGRGDQVGAVCIVRDLTDHRHAQQTIAAREEMYRAAFDDAPSGMALVEHHVGGWWRIVEANATLAALVGHPVSALASGTVTLLADHGDGRVRDLFDASGERFEAALVRPDGSRRTVVVGLSALTTGTGDPDTRRYVAQFHDVTARREAERAAAEALATERRLGDELREVGRQRKDFLATVSHELRTPLSSVLGYVELLTDGDLGPLTASQEAALDGIARNSTRLRDLVSDLLVMSAIEQGSLRAERCPTRLGDVLTRVVDRIAPDVAAREQTLDVDDAGGVLLEVDPALLEKVLLGLLTNAVKFTPTGGHISVDISAVGGQVQLRVADDGVGISAADLPHVFDPFFRAAASERLATSGTGLGLSLVRKVVEIHEGSIAVDSVPGRRTEFTLRLPTTSPARLVSVPSTPAQQQGAA